MPIIFPGLDGPAALLVGVLLLWFAIYLVEIYKAVNTYRQGRAQHKTMGEAIIRNELMRHGRAIAEANARRTQERDLDTPLDPDHPYWCEAEQAVLRG